MNIKEWKTISCTLNGQVRELTVSPAARLSDVLREQGLISVKHGCSVGECGACTVLIDGIAVDTCLYLAVWADGKQIRTAEGEMKHGKPSAVQQAYADSGAVQCGFCTPPDYDDHRPAGKTQRADPDHPSDPPRPGR